VLVEVRNADGTTNFLSATDDDGYFGFQTAAGPATGADLFVHAQGAGCVVKALGATAHIDEVPAAGDKCVVVAWPLGGEGREVTCLPS